MNRTVETTLLGQRIILTDDPENIKAILASQFGDYGMVYFLIQLLLMLVVELLLPIG